MVIISAFGGRKCCDLSMLTPHTTHVHVSGTVHFWFIEEVLKRAPNLKVIQMAPSCVATIEKRGHITLFEEQGVRVRCGCIKEPSVIERHTVRHYKGGRYGAEK